LPLFFLFQYEKWQIGEIHINKEEESIQPPETPIYNLIENKHNVVLYGPPGTGKTREALEFARWWRQCYGQDTVNQITFHPSYCYEDFIEGFRPESDGTGFKLRDGVFKTLCLKSNDDPNRKYLLLIDEINRGDVARIFGELITLIEGDKRGKDNTVLLPQSGQNFFVPDNIYILATMNTADKSISLMDLAIRRRFVFMLCQTDPDVLNNDRSFQVEIEGVRMSSLLVGINQRLMDAGIDRDRILGHSFFLIPKDDPNPKETLINQVRYEIIPMVEEYCYTDRTLMKRVLGDLVTDSGGVDTDVMDDPARFFDVLKNLTIDQI